MLPIQSMLEDEFKRTSMSFVLELVFELEHAGLALFRRILLLPLALLCLR